MAAALGAGLPVEEARGSMVVDIGGGTTEIAIISLGDIATSDSVWVAGDDMDEAIMSHMRNTYNLTIGEQSAERIKLEIGTATTAAIGSLASPTIEVRGRDNTSGMPRAVTVTSEEICQALEEPVHQITVAVKRTLERCEPELAADLIESGMVWPVARSAARARHCSRGGDGTQGDFGRGPIDLRCLGHCGIP